MAKLGIAHGDTLKVENSKLDVSDSIKSGAAAGSTALQKVPDSVTAGAAAGATALQSAGDGLTKSGTTVAVDFSTVAKKSDIPSITTELTLQEPLYWVE